MLSCIDPRVPPELLFDTWIGEHADPVDAMTRVHIKQTSADLRATPISPLS